MRRERAPLFCTRVALDAPACGRSTSSLDGMAALRFSDDGSILEIDLAGWDGDAYVTVAVESHGFKGHNDLHIVGSAFKVFCRSIVVLQRSLKGEARLLGLAPEELDITIGLADSLGHIRVSGHTGYHVQWRHTSNWHAVHFGFQIEPSQLDLAVKNKWVVEHAV